MKKDELIRFYSSIRASDSFKKEIFSGCTGGKVRIIRSKRKSFSGMIYAAAAFAAVICGGVFVISNNDELISPASGISEPVDIIDESEFVFSQEERKCKEEEERKRKEEEERRRQEEERKRLEAEAQGQENVPAPDTSDDTNKYVTGTSQSFVWPCPTVLHITDTYGIRLIPEEDNAEDFHEGIDIAEPDCEGEPVVASASGTVTEASDTGNGYGIHVILDHGNNITTLYGQMSESCVKEGDEVEQGQIIGYIGSSGFAYSDHCHFEVRVNYETVDPLKYVKLPEE